MKTSIKKLTATFLALTLTASAFTGCGKNEAANTPANGNSIEENADIQTENLPQGDPVAGIKGGEGDFLAFMPSENGIPAQAKYEYPYSGMTFALSEAILNKMESRDVVMLSSEDVTSDGNLKYATLSWHTLTEEQKNEVVTAFDPDAWKASLGSLGVLGVYHSSAIGELDSLTGCTNHKELGKSADGNYTYYLSIADNADKALVKELEKTDVTITEMLKLDLSMGKTAFSEARVDAANVGEFKTTDVNGKEYTNDLFKDYDLTLVNVFTTWCSPCVEEMPALEKFKKEMAAKGIHVAAVVYDTVTPLGETDQGAIDTARRLQEKAKLTFPLLIPDETNMNGRLNGIDGYPESFFVDKNGNIVGETYMGTHTFEEWKEIAENELAKLKGAN